MIDELRSEVLRMPTPDGGLDLFDLLYDRIIHLSADEVRQLETDAPELRARLEAHVLFEGEHADTLRHQLWSRHRVSVPPAAAPDIACVSWAEAETWPALVAAPWRNGERLRRLAETRAAGEPFLELPSFVAEEAARSLVAAVHTLSFERLDTEWVRGERRLLARGELEAWTAFLQSDLTRRLFGAVLGRELPSATTANAWRLDANDGMPVHADGRRYHGTAALGLSERWTAAQGGAIAMGAPREDRFEVRRRWFPHLGDLLLFAPTRTTWHAVEPIVRGQRLSVTAWWTAS